MNLTPEDLEKLQTKQLANVIRKLNEGKTLTAREQALLEHSRAGNASSAQSPAGYVATWDELAQALGVTRRAIQEWRRDPRYSADCPIDRADGRKEVAAWLEYMRRHGLKRADEAAAPEDLPQERRTVAEWKEYREQLECTRIERAICKDDGILLVATELEVAVGQFLAGIQTALAMLPSTASRFLVGLRDVHEVQSRLQSEVDATLTQLNLGLYLDDVLAETIEDSSADPLAAAFIEKLLFAGADRTALLALAGAIAKGAIARIGRRAVARIADETPATEISDEVTGQVTPEAQQTAGVERQAQGQPDATAKPTAQPKRKSSPDLHESKSDMQECKTAVQKRKSRARKSKAE